jgi:hypothetical protein
MSISEPAIETPKQASTSATMTQETFLEQLDKNSPGISRVLLPFIEDLKEYNIVPEYGNNLILRWHAPDTRSWNLATIVKTGEVWMDYHAVQACNLNLLSESKRFLQCMAELVPGALVKETKGKAAWNVSDADGHALRLDALLADDTRRKSWLDAIHKFQQDVTNSHED